LLGRPVKLIYYDDQSNPSTVPGIYTKLLDVDKVELVLGPYATNMVAPAVPVVMQKKKTFLSLFALDANHEFKYPNYFSVIPTGPKTKESFTEGFFQVAMAQNPKPTTVALTAEDAEFSKNACEGARENAKTFGVKVVYDKTFPPGTTDFSPIVRAVQASNADLVVVCSYPLSSVGIVQAVNEANYKPKLIGGAMVGLQATVFKGRLGAKLNGIVNYETWVPSDKMMAPAADFFKKYQARAAADGVDPLGYYLGGWGYAFTQVLGQAITGAKSVNDDQVADWLKKNELKTIMGNWKYGAKGEWTQSSMMQVQYHSIKEGAGLETWREMGHQTVLTPPALATGKVIYPYEKAK
jgi:branched-chain amino acid transport system substrate-binding protein